MEPQPQLEAEDITLNDVFINNVSEGDLEKNLFIWSPYCMCVVHCMIPDQ